jgi:hypothetical protein
VVIVVSLILAVNFEFGQVGDVSGIGVEVVGQYPFESQFLCGNNVDASNGPAGLDSRSETQPVPRSINDHVVSAGDGNGGHVIGSHV